MTYIAQRTCTVVNEDEQERSSKTSVTPLESFATTAAYVLIGEPGAGKTTTFKSEADIHGGTYVTVRNFLAYEDKPEWHDTTLYLDGLDESRAGTVDGRTKLDQIRAKLDGLGSPPFRLSCRWTYWLGASDKDQLQEVSDDGTVIVLRLDPLSKQNIRDILAKNHGIENADGFIATARERGIEGLLKNPQNLDMLAKSISQGMWPESRLETFEAACQMLVREENGEHRIANQLSGNVGQLIDAAGHLCAVQLLTDSTGYTLPDRETPTVDHPSFIEAAGESEGYARHVLGTKLFVGTSEGRLAPAHRQISEFLAAQHVAGLIDQGLPLKRILALITGFDGELLPVFRNFVAWLAVHSKPSRKRLSELNPSGLIYGGDEQTYSVEERRDILVNLRRESSWNPWCLRSMRRTSGIGKIVSPELEGAFRDILSNPDRHLAHQSYILMILQMLADGEPLPALSDLLQEIVRDTSWWPGVRCAALDVLIVQNERGQLESQILVSILAEIKAGSILDPRDELLGILLKALYPKTLSVAEALEYLKQPKYTSSVNEYTDFWTLHVPRESTANQICQLLDGIAENFDLYRSFMVGEASLYTTMGQLPIELLEKVLRTSPNEVRVDRLFNWLAIASEPDMHVPDSLTSSVRFQLEWNRDKLKELITYGVERCLQAADVLQCMSLFERCLFGARPFDYGRWCLDQALGASNGPTAALYLGQLSDCVISGRNAAGLTVETVRERLAGDSTLLSLFNEKVGQTENSDPEEPLVRRQEKGTDSQAQQDWQHQIEEQESELRAGRGDPHLLHRAAEAYMGCADNVKGRTPAERLRNLVGSRVELIDILCAGIQGSINRPDLPSPSEVISLSCDGRIHLLTLPFMAGLDNIEKLGRPIVNELSESQLRLATTILYTLPRNYLDPEKTNSTELYRPSWFRALIQSDPTLVADALRRCVEQKLATGKLPVTELNEMAVADDHSEVGALSSLPLLERFPNEETEGVLAALGWLLKAALANCEWSQLGHVVETRLARGDLAPAQRIYWLAAGFIVAPDRYHEKLKEYAWGNCDRLQGLVNFVSTARFPMELTRQFNVGDFQLLITLTAYALDPHRITEKAYYRTSDLIGKLSSFALPAATESLEALSSDSSMSPWLPAIANARDRQAIKRREQEFQHFDIRKVIKTLDNNSPANAADLAALVLDVLGELSVQIRDGNTSDWRQYWNVDHHSCPTKPKPENACRDALLSDLRNRVERLGIDVQPEGVYADDKRSDIRAGFGGFNVPVEIKRSCHQDLWTAIRNQLIAKYTRDPGAEGYGVYLVFWFGDTEKCRPTATSGWRPPNAAELKSKLTEVLSERERHRISVCVIDVSKPKNEECP